MRGGNSDEFCRCQVCLGKYTLLGDEENPRLGMFERRLPFFGCGIGWCCFLLGFLCPLIWYIAALLYCCKYYDRDPRERPGLCASAFLAIIFTAVTIVTLSVLLIMCEHKRLLTNGVLDRNTAGFIVNLFVKSPGEIEGLPLA
uniref:Uncharacterized protein n=1 Tax=Avena sativa TaxID=4498 RepID=A0ACD5TQ26_AVESA